MTIIVIDMNNIRWKLLFRIIIKVFKSEDSLIIKKNRVALTQEVRVKKKGTKAFFKGIQMNT